MAIHFNRPRLTLSVGSKTLTPGSVVLDDTQDFWVDSKGFPRAENGSVLNVGASPNPFSIIDSKKFFFSRTGQLTIESSAISDWQSIFDSGTAIVLPMLLANGISLELTFDMLRVEDSQTIPAALSVVVGAVTMVATVVLNFTVAVLTLRIFRRSKTLNEERDAVRSGAAH
ncbi:MAG: hypothetical protein ABI548_02215 [Polyangiaceae bacterium]